MDELRSRLCAGTCFACAGDSPCPIGLLQLAEDAGYVVLHRLHAERQAYGAGGRESSLSDGHLAATFD